LPVPLTDSADPSRELGIGLPAPRRAEVRSVALDHQVGDAEVTYVGDVFGKTVVTRHSVREASRLREYLVFHGHLDGVAPAIKPGATLRDRSLIGFAGDSGSLGDVHLYLEIRQVRDSVDVRKLSAAELRHQAKTVVCDPRNVLPLERR
jgi:hypothetical protein